MAASPAAKGVKFTTMGSLSLIGAMMQVPRPLPCDGKRSSGSYSEPCVICQMNGP